MLERSGLAVFHVKSIGIFLCDVMCITVGDSLEKFCQVGCNVFLRSAQCTHHLEDYVQCRVSCFKKNRKTDGEGLGC